MIKASNSRKLMLGNLLKETRKEFKVTANSYMGLKKEIISHYRNEGDLEEIKLSIEQNIVYYSGFSISDLLQSIIKWLTIFISVIALIASIFGRSRIASELDIFGLTLFLNGIVILLLATSLSVNYNKSKLNYLHFKLVCIEELIKENEKKCKPVILKHKGTSKKSNQKVIYVIQANKK